MRHQLNIQFSMNSKMNYSKEFNLENLKKYWFVFEFIACVANFPADDFSIFYLVKKKRKFNYARVLMELSIFLFRWGLVGNDGTFFNFIGAYLNKVNENSLVG
jgi:hypothetical protein